VKEQDHNNAWGFTLFVDDVRQEIGGKLSLMGLYQAEMLLPANLTFPVNIAKLCLMVMYYEKKGSLSDDITFKITFGEQEQPLLEFTILRADITGPPETASPADLLPGDKERVLHSRLPIVLSPFLIPGVGRLRVRAHYTDGSVLKLGSIAIRTVPVDEFNKATAGSPIPNPT